MSQLLSTILKYAFVIIIYLFIYAVIRMIYLDIRSLNAQKERKKSGTPYLKLINVREFLDFKISETYSLDKNVVIGRARGSNITIQDPYISSKHAQFMLEGEKFKIKDLGSTNGTTVNGKTLKAGAEKELEDGDKIHIGQIDFLFVQNAGGVKKI